MIGNQMDELSRDLLVYSDAMSVAMVIDVMIEVM
jgi:hypothetical protein